MSALQDQPINTSFLSPIGFKFQLNNFPEVNYFVSLLLCLGFQYLLLMFLHH